MKGLSTEGICVSKSIGLALYLEGNLPFLLCFTLHLRAISEYKPPGGAYIWRGDLTEGFFCLTGLRGLNVVGLIFGILRYVTCILSYSSSVCKLITLHNILQVKGAAPRNLPKFK